MAVRRIGKMCTDATAFLLCDIQEKFRPSIAYFPEICVVAERLITAANTLKIPLVATEQYPKGLGHIVPELDVTNATVFEKTLFSMATPEVINHLKDKRPDLKSVVLFGLEAHVCVQQTALDFLEMGYDVHIVADSTSSRSMTDRMIAFERIRQSGGFITTSESLLFLLLQDAKHPNFRELQKLIMESAPYQGLVPKLYKNKEMKFAVQGCTHGDLDLIYSLIDHVEKKESIKIDFLICCGDFQATRNHDDLMSMAVPKKYRQMKDFHDYYAGRKKAPLLTIFIGGNHEAANHLWELPYGGWVAENIYYLGYAGVINVGGIRIAGMSGIFNTNDFHKGYFEKPPFNESTKRSFYHIKQITTAKLKHLEGSPIDIFLSHDWPSNIQKYGDIEQIYEQKPWLREEPIQKYLIDNDPAEELLRLLKPTYWFAAHHHVKFAALVQHDSKESTKFLALGKCLPSNDFMQILNFDSPSSEVVLKYDLQWLSVLKATDHYMKKSGKVDTFENFEKEQNFYMMTEASNFCSKFRENLAVIKLDSKSNLKSRQQTVKFCEKFGLCDPCVDYESCDYSNEISDDSIEFTN